MEHDGAASVREAFSYSRTELLTRLQGLSDDEYFWEPVPGCWTVTRSDDGWFAANDPTADPAPVTTIAWRLWHLSIDCFESYSSRAFGSRATGLPDDRFVGTALEATALLRRTTEHFLARFDELGDEVWAPLGPGFGSFSDRNRVDLVLHALRELTHHGAEIGLLRDLWASREG